MLQDIANVATIVGTSLTVVALVVGLYQVRLFSKSEIAGNKAYVSVRYEYGSSRGIRSVFLVFENHGRSVARNITLELPKDNSWHKVNTPEQYPFNQESGIAALHPGATVKYFVGRPATSSPFAQLRTQGIKVKLTYTDPVIGTCEEMVELSLRDQIFAAGK